VIIIYRDAAGLVFSQVYDLVETMVLEFRIAED